MIKRSEVFENDLHTGPQPGTTAGRPSIEESSITSVITSNGIWGAVLGGVVMVSAIELALALLGAGIGLSTINPDNAKAVGIGALTWWILSGLVAFYAGGWTASRLAGIPSRTEGILHGLLTWGATTLVMFIFLTTTVGALIGGGFSLLKSGFQAAPQVAGVVGDMVSQNNYGSELNTSIRHTLQDGGVPAENLDAITGQIVSELSVMSDQSSETREIQKQMVVNMLLSNTNMGAAEATETVNQWDLRGSEVKQNIQQSAGEVKDKVQQAAGPASDFAGKGALAAFAMLIVTAIAAALGGFAGTPWPEEKY